jgi:hypothetical protein
MSLIVVERVFPESYTIEEMRELSEASGWCLETYNVKWLQTLRSSDGRRTLCFYSAPDTEAVRQASRLAKIPVERIWAADKLP